MGTKALFVFFVVLITTLCVYPTWYTATRVQASCTTEAETRTLKALEAIAASQCWEIWARYSQGHRKLGNAPYQCRSFLPPDQEQK